MARIFVTSDNQATRVEIVQDQVNGWYMAFCAGCSRGMVDPVDLTADTNTVTESDATAIASIHVDACRRCADPNCLNSLRHDVGHRCRFRPFI
jgi:hypothetical protein